MANYVPTLQKRYREEIAGTLMKEFSFKSPMEVPRLQKVVINMGLGEAVQTPKLIETAVTDLTAITGQKPVITKSKKAIANFKLKEKAPIGVMVTLRRDRMWEFMERLLFFALPRVRDFKGVSPKAFDGRGNYTLGVREQIIFPEIN
ncbi:MAG: 50S ribosomal protein L5, partial [Myxococcales bacterium]|nr:50S ribosomal protein L5 [Myxococcales bacterium]